MIDTTDNALRINITLPRDIGLQLRSYDNRSSVVAQALREKFDRDQKIKLAERLAQGYKARYAEDARLNGQFDHMTSDGIA